MPQLNAHLNFDGTCAEAMRFYQRTLGGKLTLMTFGDSPMAAQTPPGGADRIMHSRLEFDGGVLMASDTMPGQPFPGMCGFMLVLNFPSASAAREIYDVLAPGGNVIMPLQKTFWADAFGMLTDRFGTPWMVNADAASAAAAK